MKRNMMVWCASLVVAFGVLAEGNPLSAQQPLLADGNAFPGLLWQADGSAPARVIHRRGDRANPAYPHAIMKLAQVAVDVEGHVYFCSGLDGCVMYLQDGRHEILAIPEVSGQIRDLACSSEPHTIYYSVVETPRDGAPLGDGAIYKRDLWAGSPTLVATIRQADVGGNWWGTFTMRDGAFYLVTTEASSRVLAWENGVITPVGQTMGQRIEGIALAPDHSFHYVCGSGDVHCTADFQTATSSAVGVRHLTDVAFGR